MFYRRHSDKLIYPAIALILFLVFSYRPKYHLRSQMPSAFYSGSSVSRSLASDNDKKIAWAYWESALMDIQWKYSRHAALPSDPPPEFRVDVKALGPATSDPAVRELYWQRLQLVWSSPDTWKDDYEWDFGWVRDPVEGVEEWVNAMSRRSVTFPGR